MYLLWGRRAEDPFRGLRAGPVRYSPLFYFLALFLLSVSKTVFLYKKKPSQICEGF